MSTNTLITDEEFKKRVKEMYNGEYEFIDKYISGNIQIRVKHIPCGNIYYTRPESFLRGRGRGLCQKCIKKAKREKADAEFKKYVKETTSDEYAVIGKFKTTKTPIKIKHKFCGRTFKITPESFKEGHRCQYCYIQSVINASKERLENFLGDEYTILKYTGSSDKVSLKCNKCGCEFEAYSQSLYNGTGCPICKKCNQRSRSEIEVYEYVRDIFPGEVKNNVRFTNNNKKTLELDIYIPELKLGIEFDGLYWHSDAVGRKYNIDEKNTFFKDYRIRVVHIFEDEWCNHKDLTKKYIMYLLHLDKSEKVSAHKCSIKDICKCESDNFLNENSLVIYDNSNRYIGLFYKDNLAALLTIKVNKNTVKINSYAEKIDVYGGFEKFLKYIKSEYPGKKITGNIDLRFQTEDNILSKNGFTLTKTTPPRYYYCKSQNRYPQSMFKKGNLKKMFPDEYDDKLTADEIMDKTQYFRVYDCGILVYCLDN